MSLAAQYVDGFRSRGAFFEGTPAERLQKVMEAGERFDLEPGEKLFRDGVIERFAWFVLTGSYRVVPANPFAIRVLPAPQVTGLACAVRNKRSTALAEAGPRGCTVLKVPGAVMKPLFDEYPVLKDRAWDRAYEYGASAEKAIGIFAISDSVIRVAAAIVHMCDVLGKNELPNSTVEWVASLSLIDKANASRALTALETGQLPKKKDTPLRKPASREQKTQRGNPLSQRVPRAEVLALRVGLVKRDPRTRTIKVPDLERLRRWVDERRNKAGPRRKNRESYDFAAVAP